MSEVSISTFVDFVTKAGTPKLTVVKQWKNKPDYNPATDFYKAIREGIVEMHKSDQPLTYLDAFCNNLKDAKKQTAYPPIVKGYKKWVKSQPIRFYPQIGGIWECEGLSVKVNPELHIDLNGKRHILKLYFKSDKLAKNRIQLILQMMHLALVSETESNTQYGILDVRNSRAYLFEKDDVLVTALLEGEAANWMKIWPKV